MTSPDPAMGGGAGPSRNPAAPALDLAVDVDGLYAMRASLMAHAHHLGATSAQAERLLIVAGELASNAIRHGGGRGRLRMWLDDGRLVCQMTDQGSGLADPAVGTRRPDPAAVAGRGLWITRHLADEFELVTGPHGTIATAIIDLRPGQR